MVLGAGDLDRRITVLRQGAGKNALGEVSAAWANVSGLVSIAAAFRPASDSERWRAGQVEARAIARFWLRWGSSTAAITEKDRIICEGVTWSVTGIKELGRRRWLEITVERSDVDQS